jgi:hypothetical protein
MGNHIAASEEVPDEPADHQAIILGVTGRRSDPEAPSGPLADRDHERPPMATIPEYQWLRGLERPSG